MTSRDGVFFETERLLICRPDEDGIRFIGACLADSEMMKLVIGAPFAPEKIELGLRYIRKLWEGRGSHYIIVQKSSGHKAGVIKLTWEEMPQGKELDLGWMIQRAFQGQGIALEASHPLLNYAFSELQAPKVAARTSKANAAAVRLLEKLGFRYAGQLVHRNVVYGDQLYDRFELRREDYPRKLL